MSCANKILINFQFVLRYCVLYINNFEKQICIITKQMGDSEGIRRIGGKKIKPTLCLLLFIALPIVVKCNPKQARVTTRV